MVAISRNPFHAASPPSSWESTAEVQVEVEDEPEARDAVQREREVSGAAAPQVEPRGGAGRFPLDGARSPACAQDLLDPAGGLVLGSSFAHGGSSDPGLGDLASLVSSPAPELLAQRHDPLGGPHVDWGRPPCTRTRRGSATRRCPGPPSRASRRGRRRGAPPASAGRTRAPRVRGSVSSVAATGHADRQSPHSMQSSNRT